MIIDNLSNEDYHRGEDYRRYISSTQLKHYAVSPAYARRKMAEPDEQTPAQTFGSLVHAAMEHIARHGSLDDFADRVAVFCAPINAKTGAAYTPASKAYTDAYGAFLAANAGKIIASTDDLVVALNIAGNISAGHSDTAKQARYALSTGRPEVSILLDVDGVGFKVRPDLLCDGMILDYKTTASLSLSEIDGAIRRYHYDISAAMYQWAVHEETGKWCSFYWLFLAKEPPFDAVMVKADYFAYLYDPVIDDVFKGPGAVAFEALRQLHIDCTKANKWPGAETYIPRAADGARIIDAQPPMWYVTQIDNKYNHIANIGDDTADL